jgi:4'-phosphopantetheinyl transferase EntD
MIDAILTDAVVAVEAREDATDVALFPAEESSVGQAVEKRRREFTTARACVREAFAQLGLPPAAVANGPRGEPLWPAGIVGSITHCEGYRACALARASEVLTIGIDAEPNAPLPAGVLCDIAGPRELTWLEDRRRREPRVHWDRLLFSAKESVYKAWFPLAGRWLGFEDAELTLAAETGRFTARLLVPGPSPAGRQLAGFSGRWLVRDGLVLTAIVLPTSQPGASALSPSSADPRPSR